ncbi:hypothetical protein [Ochrobactrum sp. Marseille-Q0166]|nr:hypothetical protein [Ochrobactrum sp. Marseille-Q0166]
MLGSFISPLADVSPVVIPAFITNVWQPLTGSNFFKLLLLR